MGWKVLLLTLIQQVLATIQQTPRLFLLGGFLLFVAFLMFCSGRFLDSLVWGAFGTACLFYPSDPFTGTEARS